MTPACPICRQPAQPATHPFCSPRCAQIDLGRWLTQQYVAPGQDGEATQEDNAPLEPQPTLG